jgi:hypothetical protein
MLAGVLGSKVSTKPAVPEPHDRTAIEKGLLRKLIGTCCTTQAAAVMFMSAARMLAAGPVPSTNCLQLQKARSADAHHSASVRCAIFSNSQH